MDLAAYEKGFDARLRGEPMLSNPYEYGTDQWCDWGGGWLDQDHHLKSRDEALDSIGWFGAHT